MAIIFSLLFHTFSSTFVVFELLSHVSWTVGGVLLQAPLSTGFLRKEYWSRLPFPSPGHLPYPVIEAASPALAGRFFTTEPPWKPLFYFAGEEIAAWNIVT